ncbi:glycerate kinase [Dongshaea marina]|uniref:glycerate kinase n=1 Tax=Dongshaea marina TaxID=2047966 RepID=UPI000D3E56C3|nr:glycerate kinase [Dongshaea marina]
MKIVIAPDSYKESLSAMGVCDAIEKGFRQVLPEVSYLKLPMADGGEGTVQSMIDATSGQLIKAWVRDPLGQPVEGFFGVLGDGETAVIEMAAASGLHLVEPRQRNPLQTSSFGTGELILRALDHGVQKIILGIGGSATNDGGAGMLQALGAELLTKEGQRIAPGGAGLAELDRIKLQGLDPRLSEVSLQIACDVDNPLCGPKGASAVFGPQKGATPEMVEQLDRHLAHYASCIQECTGNQVLHCAGAGAAGGMGAALLGCLAAELRPGIEIVMDALKFRDALMDADLVITGEGRIDSQSVHGKTPVGIARVAREQGKPVIGIAGCLSPDCGVVHQHGLDAVFSVVNSACSLPEALELAAQNIELTARNIAATLMIRIER